jgi:peptidoglycan hydrolase FlgJ
MTLYLSRITFQGSLIMNASSSLLANPTLPDVNRQLENIRSSIAHADGAEGETRLRELKKATQEFEAVFIGYMLKVMRSTVDQAEEDEGGALGKDVYLSMFDQEIALQMARNSSLGIGEMMYRQLEQTVKDAKPVPATPPSGTALPQRDPQGSVNSTRLVQSPLDISSHREQGGPVEDSREALLAWSAPLEGRISSAFGERADPFTQTTQFHRGVDIAAPGGTPIKAARPGIVVFSGYLSGYGNTIILEHAGGFRTLYGHASRTLVRQGDQISNEQVIGEVGSSGRSTGTHLHFELQKGGKRVDPKEFLLAARRPSGD